MAVHDFLKAQTPDVLLITPLLYFGSSQVGYVRAARALGIPSVLCVGSWDHLTTKGIIHDVPDVVTVWNEAQRREASAIHGVSPTESGCHWRASLRSLVRYQSRVLLATSFVTTSGWTLRTAALCFTCVRRLSLRRTKSVLLKAWIRAIRSHANPQLRQVGLLDPSTPTEFSAVGYRGLFEL